MSNLAKFETVSIGDLAFESKTRADSISALGLRVYGVDRTDGLTPDSKYTSKDLARYKVLRPGMFAYNPMRLNIGSIAYCTEKHAVGLVSPDYIVFGCKPALLDANFFSYTIKGPEWRQWTTAAGVGSVRVRIYFRELAKMRITVPPFDEQRTIAHILGTLDKKIELNRQMNVTLEGIIQALYQSWFVDFDPVCRNADGGESRPEDALFPDSFETLQASEIPMGWSYRKVQEVVEGVYDGPHATPKESDCGPVFLGIKNLTGTGLDLSEIRHIDESDWPRWTKRVTPEQNDIVFSYEATLGFFSLIPPNLRCCLGRRLALIRPRQKDGHPHFWFHQFISAPFQSFLDQHSIHGATVNRIPLIDFPKYPILNPPDELKALFELSAAPIWQRIQANQAESRTLAALRDTLLPKLLSGELRMTEETAKI